MPPSITPTEVGGTTLASAYQKIRALQQREWAAGERFNTLYRELTQSYKRTLDDAFLRYFVYPVDGVPHWDAVQALRSDVVETLTSEWEGVTDEALDETEVASDDELEEAFLQGWYFGLWDLYQSGADVDGVEPPSSAAIAEAVIGASIGGLTLMDRARRWAGDVRLKHRTGLRSLIASEATLPATMEWFDGIAAFLNQRVSSLAVNEIHRAFELGQSAAMAQFTNLIIGEVWVTRNDLTVCPFCRSLHMTVTTLKPIEDSHPGCRCFKIPLLDGAGSRPVDFDLFLSEL